ncbi:g3626 [Coccomyxa viridis]|uniref:G3626 protein n=1 Tax=Coccomyxa viridis TaxID=1274662 RepID=A0ABP1FN96_9CHLO
MTESTPFQIGTKAPPFKLPEPLSGQERTLDEISAGASATLVMFLSNHCPFVKLLKEGIASLAKDYQSRGVAVVAISSNSVKTHPQDGPDEMAADAKQFGYSFPYLYDEMQEVAKAYRAQCTPEFMVFDKKLELQYHGQFDSARPSRDVSVTGEDLRAALDDILAGKPVGKPIKPSVGCNIKWHP